MAIVGEIYNGYNLPIALPGGPSRQLKELECMKTFEDDVLIASYPKSGTHWILEAVSMIMRGNDEYLRKDYADKNSVDGLPLIEFIEPSKLEEIPSPRLLVTHLYADLIPTQFKGKIIHLTRNPKDVAVSSYNFARRLTFYNYRESWETFFIHFLRGEVIYDSWFGNIKSWQKLRETLTEDRMLSVSYEALHIDFVHNLERIIAFLDKDINPNLLKRIVKRLAFENMLHDRVSKPDMKGKKYALGGEQLTESDGEQLNVIYRKGKVGDWKNWFTVSQSELFDKVYEEQMAGTNIFPIFEIDL